MVEVGRQADLPSGAHAWVPVAARAITWRDTGPWWRRTRNRRSDGDRVLAHGSTGSRWLRQLAAGAPTCLAVTAFDGLVVARSAFESSMRYRRAVLFGQYHAITEQDAKRRALDTITNAFIPGRSAEVRASTAKELAAVLVLALPIAEWSLKASEGWPDDPPHDVPGQPGPACNPWCNATINRSPRRTCARAYHCLPPYSACSSADVSAGHPVANIESARDQLACAGVQQVTGTGGTLRLAAAGAVR